MVSRKDIELLNIEVGTFRRLNNKISIKIDKTQFRYENIAELNELKKPEPNFLDLENIVENHGQVELTYKLSNQLKSLKNLPKEKKAIRVSIAKKIMEQNILSETNYHVSLNPANMWYYPMNNVWYAYRANELMPYDDNFSALQQYKALLLYSLTGTPYERLLNDPKEAIAQTKDELLKQIINAKDTDELTLVINSIDDYVNYHEWQKVEQAEKSTKHKMYAIIAGVIVIAVIAVGLVHKSGQKQYNALKQESQQQVNLVTQRANIKIAIKEKNWKKANKAMKKAGYSAQQRADTYLKINQYQQAINAKPSMLRQITKQAYKNHDTNNILSWQTPSGTSDKINEQLKLEKAIINYDEDILNNQLSFENNSDVLLRIGEAFNDHNNEQDAQTTQAKLVAINKTKGNYLEALIKLSSANQEVKDSQNKLDTANKIDGDKDKSKDDKVKEAQSNLENAQKDQKQAQKTADKLAKKVGA